MADDDVAEVPGGFDALEDDAVFDDFMNRNLDNLVEKYMDQLCAHFEGYAREEYEEGHGLYESKSYTRKPTSMLEELEEPDSYNARLASCPECGTARFDKETGICINCGFNILIDDNN